MAKSVNQIFVFNGDGTAEQIEQLILSNVQQPVWVKLKLNQAAEPLAQLDVPLWAKQILLAKETRPKVRVFQDTLIGIFRGVNKKARQIKNEMVSLRIYIKGNVIITVQRYAIEALTSIEESFEQKSGPETVLDFLEQMLALIVTNASEVVSHLAANIDRLEDRKNSDSTAEVRAQLNEVRRRIILLRRYLVPQREAISALLVSKLSWLNQLDANFLHERLESLTRILEDLEAEKERANVIQEEMFAISQEKINRKMYLLTIVAVIFMPLSFITGLLGVNLAGIPGATFKYAFESLIGVLLLILVVQLIFLRNKGWFK